MELAVIAFTARGALVAQKICRRLGAGGFVRAQDAQGPLQALEQSLTQWTHDRFADSQTIVFIGAAGIAVRAIAPYVKSKASDPAVLVIDEGARFVIALLSGHLGGANQWAQRLAEMLGALPVITTATDARGVFAVDTWAKNQGFTIENPRSIVNISAALLDGKSVGLCADAALPDCLPDGLAPQISGELGICVSTRIHAFPPFQRTLFVRPRVLTLGAGCKRGVKAEIIAWSVDRFLRENQYSEVSVTRLSSIDLKADEEGMIALARQRKWDFATHGVEELMEAQSHGGFSSSEFVRNTVGIDCVCERAAALYGDLRAGKKCYEGVTLALSEAPWQIAF